MAAPELPRKWRLTSSMRLLILLMFLLPILPACDKEAVFQRFIPQEEAAEGQKVFAQVAARDWASIESRLDQSLQQSDIRQKLEEIASQVPPGNPKSVATIGSNTVKGETDVTYNLTYEYEYETSWLVVNVVLERKAGSLLVSGIHLYPTSQSQKTRHQFSLSGKSFLHYLVLFSCVAVPIFILVTLVLAFRTPIARRKWLWRLFVALGPVQLTLNWTTGEFSIQPISLMLLGAGFYQASPYGPYFLSVALPIGALVFLARRKALMPRSDS